MAQMSDRYQQLLEVTMAYLDNLKACGVRFVPVSPETLAALAAPPPRQTRSVSVSGVLFPRSGEASQAARPPSQAVFELAAPASAASGTLDPVAKEAAMAQLRSRASVCQKCPRLAASRKNVVFGVGDIHSPLMFVGEAPGADEDAQGEPFVGKAGQLLTKIIQVMGFRRDTVYIANILKCRPDTPGQTTGNRKPTAEEMKTCLPYLLAQIDVIQPRVIVALGATAVEGLLGIAGGITRLRGRWQEFRGVPLMPTYHPAYLLRNEALGEKRKVWEDMLQVLEKLGQPISQKQRNYFLAR